MERSISSRLNSRRSPSPRGGGPLGSSKLRMDRKPSHVRITDPSHPAGKRKEIDNVMRKARAFPNETWDKKLLEAEEKDPNRWRHTGFKKMYIEDDPSSSDSDRGPGGGAGGGSGGHGRFGNGGRRSRSRSPRSPLPPPPRHRRSPSPPPMRKRRVPVSPSPPPPPMRRRPPSRSPSPLDVHLKRRPRSPPPRMRRASPPPPEYHRKSSPPPRMGSPPPHRRGGEPPGRRMSPLPPRARGKRPPSPPPKMPRSVSASSGSEDSCSGCSMDERHHPRSRPPARWPQQQQPWSGPPKIASDREPPHADQHADRSGKEAKDPRRKEPMPKVHRVDKDPRDRPSRPIPPPPPPERVRHPQTPESDKMPSPKPRVSKHKPIPEDPRPAKARQPKPAPPPPPPEAPAPAPSKKHKEKTAEKQLRARVKIEGEPKQRRPRSPSSGSEDSSSSESSLPRFTATTRLTLSERFGKMAQWSVDRSNMENMRITKNSSGGDLKVMIEEEMEATQPPPARYAYSPAPAGHFPEELMTTGPSGLSSWDDVRVRYEYYKGRGYLRDLDLEDYVKWEEWWYKYQEWLKQERYYEMWERSQLNRRRKKVPIAQRLN